MTDIKYRQEIAKWRAELDAAIRKENGWLALAGLFWLKLGKNEIGSDSSCRVQLPARLPSRLGTLDFDGRNITLRASQPVRIDGESRAYAVLHPDISENPTYVWFEDVCFIVIQRGNKIGVRLWDNQREQRKTFPPRAWFEIDETYRIAAVYAAYEHPKKTYFPDLTGEKAEFPVEGWLTFEFSGKQYRLDANKEEDGSLFVRFWDPTGRDETYPSGRYLVAEERNGKLFIDFNKAYSPPCSFTDYATCVFAPEQNRLDFRVNAGEKYIRNKTAPL